MGAISTSLEQMADPDLLSNRTIRLNVVNLKAGSFHVGGCGIDGLLKRCRLSREVNQHSAISTHDRPVSATSFE
jgi:hypothetical protein